MSNRKLYSKNKKVLLIYSISTFLISKIYEKRYEIE